MHLSPVKMETKCRVFSWSVWGNQVRFPSSDTEQLGLYMPLIPASGRLRQEECPKLHAFLSCDMSTRPARMTRREPFSSYQAGKQQTHNWVNSSHNWSEGDWWSLVWDFTETVLSVHFPTVWKHLTLAWCVSNTHMGCLVSNTRKVRPFLSILSLVNLREAPPFCVLLWSQFSAKWTYWGCPLPPSCTSLSKPDKWQLGFLCLSRYTWINHIHLYEAKM